MPHDLRAAHDAGEFFLTLEVAAKTGLLSVAALNSQIPERTPAALRNDPDAKWQHWPMRIKPDFCPGNGAN